MGNPISDGIRTVWDIMGWMECLVMVWSGLEWYDMAWNGMTWHEMV